MEILRTLDMLDTIVRVGSEYASFAAGGASSPPRLREKARSSAAAVDLAMLQGVALSLRTAAERLITDRDILLDHVTALKQTVNELTHVASAYRSRYEGGGDNDRRPRPATRRPWQRVACPGASTHIAASVREAGVNTDATSSPSATGGDASSLQRALEVARADGVFWAGRVAQQEGIIDALERALSIQRHALRSAASASARAQTVSVAVPREEAQVQQQSIRRAHAERLQVLPPLAGEQRGRAHGVHRHDWRVDGSTDRGDSTRRGIAEPHVTQASAQEQQDRGEQEHEEHFDAAEDAEQQQAGDDDRGEEQVWEEDAEESPRADHGALEVQGDDEEVNGQQDELVAADRRDESVDTVGSESSDDERSPRDDAERDAAVNAAMRTSVDEEWPFHVFRSNRRGVALADDER